MFLFVIPVLLLSVCFNNNDNGESTPFHDNTKWFTEEKLLNKRLSYLGAPSGISVEIYSNVHWLNNSCSFSQPCVKVVF